MVCSRRTLQLFKYRPEHCRKALEVAERHADGEASADELHAALRATEGAFSWLPGNFSPDSMSNAANHTADAVAYSAIRVSPKQERRQLWQRSREVERAAQAALLRCIFSDPFHPVTINAAWLTWNDGTVQKIAQAIYEERAFERMPILADALEEAGCTETEILNHCRQPGEHVRGRWVVDLCLGKE